MQRSSKLLALALATAFLAGCGLIRKDEGVSRPETIMGLPGKPGQTAPGKPAEQAKPGEKPEEKPQERPDPKADPQQRFNDALAMMKGNQTADAEQAFTWLTQDFPAFAGPWTNLGIIYAKSNRNPQAIAAFVRAVNIDDDIATAYNWLGILYRQARDYTRAEDAYKNALKANDEFGLAHLNLGILYDEYLRRPQDALPHYKEYLKYGGQSDLRVQAWIAAIEHPNPGSGIKPTSGSVEKP